MKTLEELKAYLRPPPAKERLACSLFPSGVSRGAITEITGTGKTEFVVHLLRENPALRVAWIEKRMSMYPVGFLQRNIALHRILMIEALNSVSWACLTILKSKAFGMTVIHEDDFDLTTLRKFQLACERSNSALLWLSPKPHRAWPIHQGIWIQKSESLQAHALGK